MSQIDMETPLEIADDAEFERWQNVRTEVRRRLTASVTFAFFYLIAALAVGGYLVVTVRDVCSSAVFLDGWAPVEYDVDWMTQIAWGYAGAAIVVLLFFPLTLLLIHHKLPSVLTRMMNLMPWIGATMRVVSLADFFQSMYRSVLQSKTYSQAMATASKEVHAADLRQWSAESAHDLDAGHSLASVLESSPVRESPMLAMSVLAQDVSTAEQTRQTWHQAVSECHLLAMSRLTRTNQFLSVSCLLLCVLLASFALFVSVTFLAVALKGLMYDAFLFMWLM